MKNKYWHTDRRTWLRYISLSMAGLGMAQLKTYALPIGSDFAPDVSENDRPVRLSSNENPYGPSPLAKIAMADSINKSNRYNWDTTSDLIAAISTKNGLSAEHILLGPGSTEILDVIAQSFALSKGSFIVADPSFTNWAKTAEKIGLEKISIPLTKDKRHDLVSMLAAIKPDTRFIYICNPNNPTGTVCEKESLVFFIKEATKKVTVLVDEAYIDFTSQTSVHNLVAENENLIVVKTFSKIYGLAGARVGYAIANATTINQISQLQTWANGGVSTVSRAGAIASLKDTDFVQQCYDKNEAVKKYTTEQLARLNIASIPSHTNFIYFSLENYKKDFFSLLKNRNIEGTRIFEEDGKWTRITLGTMQEMQKFIQAIT